MNKLLFGHSLGDNKLFNVTWLFFRFYVGISIAIGAGLSKIGADMMAPDWFVKQVGEIGFTYPSPAFWAAVATWGEFLGGILLALGLLTRLASLQLAFQFFIVSFIWYKEPMPLVGMYYQQLIFWGYVLTAVGGGGRYSIDQLINKKWFAPRMISPSV